MKEERKTWNWGRVDGAARICMGGGKPQESVVIFNLTLKYLRKSSIHFDVKIVEITMVGNLFNKSKHI